MKLIDPSSLHVVLTSATASAASGLQVANAIADGSEASPFSVWVFLACMGGALINVLWAVKKGGQPIDLALAGLVAMFTGFFLAPVFRGVFEAVVPGFDEAGAVGTAAITSLFGARLIEFVIRGLNKLGQKGEGKDD